MTKECTRCLETLPADTNNFYRNGNGLKSWCKECSKKYQREKYWNKPEKKEAMMKPWIIDSGSGVEDRPIQDSEKFHLYEYFQPSILMRDI